MSCASVANDGIDVAPLYYNIATLVSSLESSA